MLKSVEHGDDLGVLIAQALNQMDDEGAAQILALLPTLGDQRGQFFG